MVVIRALRPGEEGAVATLVMAVFDAFVGPLYSEVLVLEAVAKHVRPAGIDRVTVNASPNSVTAYESMGFRATNAEKSMNGIRFVRMELDLSRTEDRTG